MKKTNKKLIIISSVVILLPMIFGLIIWDKLPDVMPSHFDFEGNVNDTTSKPFAVFGMPLLLLGIHLLCIFATLKDPKNENVGRKVMNLIYFICPAVSILSCVVMYGYALGYKDVSSGTPAALFLGLTFIIVGNYMPKCRQNYTVGIKIPWTLASEKNWYATHRFAGWTWSIAGIAVIILGLMKMWWLMIAVLFALTLAPVIYSYIYYEKYDRKK